MDYPNEVRDPVHGVIKFTNGERGVIDSQFMQRLRRVTQLTAAEFVYPGGVHTRYLHSLGVMHLCGEYMESIIKNSNCIFDDSSKLIRLARMAGLLHDVGHGPFSHAFDRSVYSHIYSLDVNSHWPDGGHDLHRIEIVKFPTLATAIEAAGVSVADLIRVWQAKPSDNTSSNDGIFFIIKTIVGGPLGADRIDFVKRDSLFTGMTHYGTISSGRIIDHASVRYTPDGQYLLMYDEKCVPDVEHALNGRRYMYEEVYFHKTCIAASLVIERMMDECCKEFDLIENTRNLVEFADLDEHSLVERARTANPLSRAYAYVQMYLLRILPKPVYRGKIPPGVDINKNDIIKTINLPLDVQLPPPNIEFFKTRPITGIDPVKFDYYNIRFIKKDGEILTCAESMSQRQIVPIDPYCIVHGYIWPHVL